MRLWKNKLVALVLLIVGILPIIFDNDGTAFLLFLMIGIPLLISKENMIA